MCIIFIMLILFLILFNQALSAELIPFLLKLLDSGIEGLENPAATKAQIVKALKAMQKSLVHGEKVGQVPELTMFH